MTTEAGSSRTFLFDTNIFIHIREQRKPKYVSTTVEEFNGLFYILNNLGDRLIILDSVLKEIQDHTLRGVVNQKHFEIKRTEDIPDEIREKVKESTEMKLTSHGGTADYDLICFMLMNPDWILVTNDNALCFELNRLKPDAKYLPNWGFLFLSALRTGVKKHQKLAAKELQVDAKLQVNKTVVDWPNVGLKGLHDFMRLDFPQSDLVLRDRERGLVDRNLMLYDRIRELESRTRKSEKEMISKKTVKPGIVSNLANWVFVKANPFKWGKKKELKRIEAEKNESLENNVTDLLGNPKKMVEIGSTYCLYMGELSNIDKIGSDEVTIVPGDSNIAIPVTMGLEGAEFMISKSKMARHLISEFDVSQDQVKPIIQRMLDEHTLFNKRFRNPESRKNEIFVGLSRLMRTHSE